MQYNSAVSTAAGSGGPRIDIDYRMQLIKQRESAAPFLSFMLHLNSQATKTHVFKGFETRPNPKFGTVNGAVNAVAANTPATVTLVAGEEKRFAPGDLVIPKDTPADVSHSNVGRVSSVSTNTVVVYGNDTSLGWVGVADGEILQIWGRGHAQGMLSANPQATIPALKTFYTGIFKHAYSVDKTQENNRLYGAPERDRLRGEAEIEHIIEIEKQLLRGDGTVDLTTDTSPRTNITGILNQISSNVLSYGGALNKGDFFTFMSTLHAPKYATDGKMSRRLVIASADVLNMINSIALETNRTISVTEVYGMDVFKTQWMGRTWDFIEDPILSDFLPGWAVVFQPRYVKLREFRPTRLEANIQANDADYIKDQFLTEIGLEVQLEELHGVMHP
jgi:hypothetical protein